MAKRPPRTDFSDAAKTARGIAIAGVDGALADIERKHHCALLLKQDRINDLEAGVSLAIDAHLEGRRGDALKTLKALMPQHSPKPKPKTGGDAA